MPNCRVKLLSLGIALLSCSLAFGQAKVTPIYTFGTNQNDGSISNGDLVFDQAGNIYGTTQRGGIQGAGTVFKLSPMPVGGWTETVLYNFCSQANCTDGQIPEGGVILDSTGNLYGTTAGGGSGHDGNCRSAGCGVLFRLARPGNSTQAWNETVIWNFAGDSHGDGQFPNGELVWGGLGNLYGTTVDGGSSFSLGTVFQLTPQPDGTWTESVLHAFCADGSPCSDGALPTAGLSFDNKGNLFGTTNGGGINNRWGVIFELSPAGGDNWTEKTLYRFVPQDGGQPFSPVNFDKAGNAYVTAFDGSGSGTCGSVLRFTPARKQQSYLFSPAGTGCNPGAGVFIDNRSGTVYGTTETGGAFNSGVLYKIAKGKGTILYSFCSQQNCTDGSKPAASLTSHSGKLYSTTSAGGQFNQGVVFEVAPQ